MFDANTLVYIGTHLARSGLINEAICHYDKAIEIDPFYSPAHWRRSMLHLLIGEYHHWPQYFALTDSSQSLPYMGWYKRHMEGELLPEGNRLDGKIVYIYNDQGVGDFIQFVRYANNLKCLGATVIVECKEDLQDIVSTCFGVHETVPPESKVSYDYHCPLMLLPHYFGIARHEYHYSDGYLKAPDKITDIAELIKVYGDTYKVGICWKGNPKHVEDSFRSVPADMFEQLQMDGVELFSLQKGALGTTFINTGVILRDWTDTAMAIEALDLVITVDTSVAHLAGSLGKPVWLLLSLYPDWRWGLTGCQSRWYNSMCVFRQRYMNEWVSVFKDVRDVLAHKIKLPS